MVNIMVVEDEKPISNLIALSLKKAGYHSECAYDGLEAIDMLEKNYPDLILLDIMLPGADGFEILEYVKPLEIPVIFLIVFVCCPKPFLFYEFFASYLHHIFIIFSN